MLTVTMISAPRPGTVSLLTRRMTQEGKKQMEGCAFDAIGLIQSDLPHLFYYADAGQKAGNVIAVEIPGTCPQHISTIAFFGSNEAVKAALEAASIANKQPR